MAKEFTPNKVFIICGDGYTEITPAEHQMRQESDSTYRCKYFIPLHGMLMEVCEKDYTDYYRAKRRQKYVRECALKNGEIS